MYSSRNNKIFSGIYPHLIFIFELLNFKRRFRRSDSSNNILTYLGKNSLNIRQIEKGQGVTLVSFLFYKY